MPVKALSGSINWSVKRSASHLLAWENPSALKHALSGFWSRRITDEHRMVYKIEGDAILIAQLRYHY